MGNLNEEGGTATGFKYNCRKCPIRNRCIDENHKTANVRQMLKAAFEARTDTLTTWKRLQQNCLLVKAEKERAERSAGESLLSRRLRKARETGELKDPGQPPNYLQPVKSSDGSTEPKIKHLRPKPKPILKPLPSKSKPLSPVPGEPEWMASTSTAGESAPDFLGNTSVYPDPDELYAETDESSRPYWLTIAGSGRHIKVPSDGELVLGRFDPHIGIPPDIDLGLEDITQTISRRHAKIIGRNGFHTVEDLGSSQGVKVNGAAVIAGDRHKLEAGDRIKLGKLQMVYEAVPTHILIISSKDRVQHLVTVTSTGSQFEIAPPDDVTIGRYDTFIDFVPDIDLGEEGEVSARVSRRHTIITWRDNLPYVEDLGSGFGTRLNGKMLLMGQAKALKPGDHLWLGGCVLGYDVKL